MSDSDLPNLIKREQNGSDNTKNQFEASSSEVSCEDMLLKDQSNPNDEPRRQKLGSILETKLMPPPASTSSVSKPVQSPVKLDLKKSLAVFAKARGQKPLTSTASTFSERQGNI